MGAADHRAVPGRTPGRCAGRRTSGSGTGCRTSSASTPDRNCSSSSNGSWSTTRRSASAIAGPAAPGPTRRSGTCRRCRPSSSVASRTLRPCPTCSRGTGSSRSSGREASGRPRWRSPSAAGSRSSNGVGSGGVWLARLETAATPDDVIDTLIAALHVPGGEDALFERLKGTTARGDPGQLRTRHRRCRGARRPPPRRRARAADPVHQPGPARRRR